MESWVMSEGAVASSEVDTEDALISRLKGEMISLYAALGKKPLALEDATRYVIYTVPGGLDHRSWSCQIDLKVGHTLLGVLRTPTPIVPLEAKAERLLNQLLLILCQLDQWTRGKSERYGLLMERVLFEGWTSAMHALFADEGMKPYGRPMVLMGTSTATPEPSLRLIQGLRQFVLARLWRYEHDMPFVVCRPNAIFSVLVKTDMSEVAALGAEVTEAWYRAYGERLCTVIVPIQTLAEVKPAVSTVNMTLLRARERGAGGVIIPDSKNLVQYLQNLGRDEMIHFSLDILRPLLNHENQILLETLKVYLQEGHSVTKAAQLLHVHRNTVIYRIGQAEKLLGLQLKNIDDLTTLWVAMRGYEMVSANQKAEF
ncbi:MAG: helix-turn-helix domain-containing protein [Firmicutes bacterium]|nr:helix-turn-helix domain-containing protein [Bacillota bacterium]